MLLYVVILIIDTFFSSVLLAVVLNVTSAEWGANVAYLHRLRDRPVNHPFTTTPNESISRFLLGDTISLQKENLRAADEVDSFRGDR